MKNVHLKYSGRLKKVRSAVYETNKILADPEFYRSIVAYRRFDNSPLSPEVIARLMQESDHEINVRTNWFFSFSGATSFDTIHVNTWDFSSHLPTAVNTLIHETVSAIDCLYDILNHDAQTREKENHTACFVIGAIAEVMVNENLKYGRENNAVTAY